MNITHTTETRFEYFQPSSLDHALQLLGETAVTNKILAGGTDLMPSLRKNRPLFDRIIDISRISELKTIGRNNQTIQVGAGVTFSEAMESNLLEGAAPFLIEMCGLVGSPQIRNLGTLGGNVVNAATCADSLPVLVSLDTIVHLRSAKNRREIPISEFVAGTNHTQIRPDELLTHFSFDIPPRGIKTKFMKIARGGISRLSIAVMGGMDENGAVSFIRITPGSISPHIVRFSEVENILIGHRPHADRICQASLQVAEIMLAATGTRWSTEYKTRAINYLAEQALSSVFNSGIIL